MQRLWLVVYLITQFAFLTGNGGEGGIRTLEAVSRPHAFQACALSHSATSPHGAPFLSGLGFRKVEPGRSPKARRRGRETAEGAPRSHAQRPRAARLARPPTPRSSRARKHTMAPPKARPPTRQREREGERESGSGNNC